MSRRVRGGNQLFKVCTMNLFKCALYHAAALTHPFQNVILVFPVVHEQCYLPAGIAVDRVHLHPETRSSNAVKLDMEKGRTNCNAKTEMEQKFHYHI